MPCRRQRLKTHNEFPLSRQRMKMHNELPFVRWKTKNIIWDREETQIPKPCCAEKRKKLILRINLNCVYLSLIGIILRWGFLIWDLIFIYCGLFVLILVVFFFLYVSAKFHLWPSSGDLPWPRIGMLSLVTVTPVITAFPSSCLSHHVFHQVNLWPSWVEFETAIFWQWSPRTVETQRHYPLRHGPQRWIFWSYKSLSGLPESGPYRIFVLVFNWNHFEMKLLNLRLNFYLLRTYLFIASSFRKFMWHYEESEGDIMLPFIFQHSPK